MDEAIRDGRSTLDSGARGFPAPSRPSQQIVDVAAATSWPARRVERIPRTVQAALDAPVAAPEQAPVEPAPVALQRDEASNATVESNVAPDPAGPTSGTGGSAGAPADGASPEQQLDDLARRLYERIRLRLRGELLVDLERSGRYTGGG
jgi:hypothetical protein